MPRSLSAAPMASRPSPLLPPAPSAPESPCRPLGAWARCACMRVGRHGSRPRSPARCVRRFHARAECNSRQRYNSLTGACDCLSGWAGPECDACQTSSACAAYYNVSSSAATCSTSVPYQQESNYKAYTCDLAVRGSCGADAWAWGRAYAVCARPWGHTALVRLCPLGYRA